MIPQRGSDFYADHRGARPQVVDTVARGQLQEDSYFYTGVIQGANGYREEQNLMPFPVTMEVLERGQERFNVYCTPCHSRVGNGLGEIVERGYKPAANLHDQVRRAQPLSHYFYVMTHGYGAMPDYSRAADAGRSLGSRGLHSRIAIKPGGHAEMCPRACRCKSLSDVAEQQTPAGQLCAAMVVAGNSGAGISADERRNAGDGSGKSG